MKVLFILHYPPPVHGAAAVGLFIKESHIINNSFDCTYVNLGTSVTVKEIGKHNFNKLYRYFCILANVLWNLIFNRPDVCYLSITAKCIPFYKDVTFAFLIKLFRVKIVYHFHNKGVQSNQHKFIDNLLYTMVFRNSKVILISKHLYSDIQKYVNEKDVFYCANGIPSFGLNNNSVQKIDSNKPSECVNLLFLSNLILSKGIYVLLDALVLLEKRNLNFHCTVVGGIGDISKNEFLEKLDMLKLTNNVSYLGAKFGNEKENEFLKADIFVHPTLNDCFPLVLLEAMKFSLPIISTYEGGIPDIVDDGVTGFLVPKSNSIILADKIECLINNPELRNNMAKAGYDKVNASFNLEVFENRIRTILRSI